MKKFTKFLIGTMLVAAMVLMASCGTEFGLTENTGKAMTVNAKRAAKDSMFVVGVLDVEEGEAISVTSDLEKGEVNLDFLLSENGEYIDEIPDYDGEPVFVVKAAPEVSSSASLEKGEYYLRATVTEKATGTIKIEVVPAE